MSAVMVRALYFTLTDGSHELQCMLWRSHYRNKDIDLEDGFEVIVHGDIDYWVEGGKLDIKPWRVTVVGEGEQAAALERSTSELEQCGWFDDEHKKDTPQFPTEAIDDYFVYRLRRGFPLGTHLSRLTE